PACGVEGFRAACAFEPDINRTTVKKTAAWPRHAKPDRTPKGKEMFAVIRTGGRQYRVAADDVLQIQRVAGEPGDIIQFGEVLALGEGDNVTLGAPLVGGASVAAEVVEH